MPCLVYTTVRSPVSKRFFEKSVERSLRYFSKETAAVSVHVVGVVRSRRLNRIYRGIDRPTDVLSFAAEGGIPGDDKQQDLGDIFLCAPCLRRQARRFGVPLKEEMERMLTHGLLHLLGFDHETASEARRMFALQEKLIRL